MMIFDEAIKSLEKNELMTSKLTYMHIVTKADTVKKIDHFWN